MAHYRATCSLKCLAGIREFVREELSKLGIQEEMANQLVLVVDEACTNSILHQHRNDGISQFDLYIRMSGAKLMFEIHDKGEPFPIDEYKPKELNDIVAMRIHGGLGINLIHKIMDKVEVDRKKGHFAYRFIKIVPRVATNE
ncbi:MAG: ATP-binding protein [Bacteroidia bacterium]|nr:ATP-binding protein [Bacteroidia bacterium]